MVITVPDELEPHIIGLWRFRQVARAATWCTTFLHEGKFYDTPPAKTADRALARAARDLRKAKRGKQGVA